MKTKLVFAAVAASIVATTVFAANPVINIVNGGSESGSFRQILNLMSENFDNTFVQANNPVVAEQNFNQDNVLTVWSSEWPGKPDMPQIDVTEDNLVALMVYETLVCSREYTSFEEMAGKTVKLATWGSDTTARFVAKLGEEKGINFQVVPYDGSGAITQGYIGRDADTALNITTRQAAMEEDTSTNCFAFSANGDLSLAFIDAVITLNASDEVTAQMREIAEGLKSTPEFQDSFKGLSLKVPTVDTVAALIADYDTAVVNFTPE